MNTLPLHRRKQRSEEPHRLVIWQILDQRPGHRNQVLGLTEAILRRTPAEIHELSAQGRLSGLRCLWPGSSSHLKQLATPDVLVAAGHRTHLPLLSLRRRFGGHAVVLMKPSLPLAWFDLCLIPDSHAFRSLPDHVVLTRGALNRIRPGNAADSRRGVILVGGPSAHFSWSDDFVVSQIAAIVRRDTHMSWTTATSRRTPASFVRAWESRRLPGHLVTPENASPDWLPEQLSRCGQAWVTADSVSMLYEALSAGTAVGLLELPGARATRVSRAVASLVTARQIVPFSRWHRGAVLQRPTAALQEADRCAEILLSRFFPDITRTRRAA